MTTISRIVKNILGRIIITTQSIRQAAAIAILLALLLPIAVPIPVWASVSIRLPGPNDYGFRLSAPSSSPLTSVSDLASKFMSGPAAFFSVSGESRTKKETGRPSIAELEKKVAGIKTEITNGEKIKIGQLISLAALPVDKNGETVNGVAAKWHCANPEIIRILNDSEAVAVGNGETRLIVSSGKTIREINIAVAGRESEPETTMFDDPLEVPVITEPEAQNLVTPENNLGSPVGQTEMSSASTASATRTRERYGSSNYSFGLPIASLPGRGLDASVGITYNSRVWSKSEFGGTRIFEFNPNKNWLAPGFEIGFGEITSFGTSGGNGIAYMLTSPDGTRHQLAYKQASGNCTIYESNDGTFIQTTICGNYTTSTMNVVFPDGTQVMYGGTTSSGKRFPIRITDRNGNMLTISYLQNDYQGKIHSIRDTLNRYINFHYDNTPEKKLVAVSVPGYADSSTPRQTIRFYYEEMLLQTTGRFESPAEVNAPATITVLKHVYFPGTQSGYTYDYSPYFGSIYKISQRRGMTINSNGTNETGSVTSEGTEAAWTHYNYAATAMETGPPLTDVPKYSWRKDDWLGRTTDVAHTSFLNLEEVTPTGCQVSQGTCTGTRTVTVTAPDGTKSVSVSLIKPTAGVDAWKNGLLDETRLVTIEPEGEKIWSKTKLFWQQGANQPAGRSNPRLSKIETTNDAEQTKATSFEYDIYNNQTVVREHDFDVPGNLGTELRRTEIVYVTTAGWVNNRLLRLPETVRTIVSGVVTAKVVYEYDNNGATLSTSNITYRSDIDSNVHDVRYNPSAPPGGQCMPDCDPQHRCCWDVPVYQQDTRFRGNVTKITSFSDATLETDPNASVSTVKYDITGNVVETAASCCELRTVVYLGGNRYAYPVSETRSGQGLSMTTSATYDLNTGLMRTATDENGQTTTVTYDPATLRAVRTDAPNDAWTTMEYNDSTFPYHVKSTASLDATRSVSSWSFSNGRGQAFRSRSQTNNGYLSSEIDYDIMGRPVKTYSPHTVPSWTEDRPSGIKSSEIVQRDGLGRALKTRLPDLTEVLADYNGLVATATDQAGKSRRQIADTLGRTVRVDEPDANGNLGDVSSPVQPTYYEYDGNDNLTKVIQSDGTVTQQRLFKYDSLSRLTHEKQVEANATLNDSGVHVGGSGTWTGVYKYDTDSLLEWGVDARGVKTKFTYDGLHRVSLVEYENEIGYQTPTVTYTYDETELGFFNSNRLTKVETALSTTYGTPATVQHYRYDKRGQVVKHTQSIGSESYLQEYGYNLAGQMTSQKYPSGRVVNMAVDDFGRLATVADSERTYVNGLAFNNQGMLSQMNLGNGTHETFAYNDRFQMTSQSLMKGAEMLQKYDYSYGQTNVATGTVDTTKNNGQLGKIESFIGTNKQASQRFAYDQLGRLKEAREHRGDDSLTYKQVFDFDRFGNKYRKAASNPTTGQANPLPFTPIEEATTPGTGDIDKAMNRFRTGTTYNDAGQVIGDSKFRDLGYAYDANGRQVKATKTNQPDAWTVYDALGNRVATKINDVWQLMVYDAFGKLVAEYGVAAENIGGVKYIQQDWQGSVRAVTNSNGFVVARTDHQAFGEEVGLGIGLRSVEQGYSADKATRQGYGLTENDSATGQQHTWFRKLETQAGRWSSPDPYKGSMRLGDPQSFNRYSYVQSDPVNFVDPSGLVMIVCRTYDYSTIDLGSNTVTIREETRCEVYFNGGGGPLERPTGTPIEIPGGEPGGGGSGGHEAVHAQTNTCGVNPITGKPGISRDPANQTGNVRSDRRGGGLFSDTRGRRLHGALDIAGVLNTTPVVAPFSGTVIFSGNAGGKPGQTVIINHDNGMQSQIMHMQAGSLIASTTNGQPTLVNAGDQIGVVGNTGNGNLAGMQTHAHWILKDKPGGTRIDPEKVLNSPCPP